jgi:hypothetical protein
MGSGLTCGQSDCDQAKVTLAVAAMGRAEIALSRENLPDWCQLLVIVQKPEDVTARQSGDLRQEEVYDDGIGLSRSRNLALRLAATDLVLFVDDDMTLDLKGVARLRAEMIADLTLALAVGWRAGRLPPGTSRPVKLGKLNSGRVCAPEFMVRKSLIDKKGIQFDESFGVGTACPTGEDYIFVTDAMSAGLVARSYPVVTGSHPHQSTGDNWHDQALLAARRKVLSRVFGGWAPLLRVAYAAKHLQALGGLVGAWKFVRGYA